eukprot:TRINITY_DN6892_c0_g1_i20.p1 TRINITY_DN6892_c0_g1~~TRINITY_DN6892_c0_g1_i20.p1  ORF type:complete len:393 (-),score=101.75 TRINITY_DN6892_c0_g1_i20:98-1186(-)
MLRSLVGSEMCIRDRAGAMLVRIGLELHAQILSTSKMFSHAAVSTSAAPNTCIALLDAGLPGSLPVLNRRCVEQGVKTALALSAQVHTKSYFERKHYFYADMPLGFQITQQASPVATGGSLGIPLKDGSIKQVRINRLQLEQDSGKSVHDVSPELSLVDLNRAGVGLMEIVSAPDMNSAEEACSYVKAAQALLRCIGTCDGNMEDGSLRCDVNVSVELGGVQGNRCEIKNLNSIKSIGRAIDFEVKRHSQLISKNQPVPQQTRRFDIASGETVAMRSKENSVDYRFMPEPDLPPLILDPKLIQDLAGSLPELPHESTDRLQAQHGLSREAAVVLLGQQGGLVFFEAVVQGCLLYTSPSPRDS